MLNIFLFLVSEAANWFIFKKMGRQGWEGIIPIYKQYVLCTELYGKGWKFLLLFVPLYNIYFAIKLCIDWAHAFHKSTGFAIGLLLLPVAFELILAFDSNSWYRDGSRANTEPDLLTEVADKTRDFTDSVSASMPRRDDDVLQKIEKLSELRDKGILTEEEYEEKKEELLKKV